MSARRRDVPENEALVRQALGTGLLSEATVESILNFHAKNGTDPAGVFRSYISSARHVGKPPIDTSGLEPDPLEPFEADILRRLQSGELKTEKLV